MFEGKKIMITGGTGSFGSTVVKRFLSSNVEEIRIFSRDEKKQEDMRNTVNDEKLKFYIGDTRDFDSVEKACKGVDYVFQAAALKQVPSCEFYPMEAVRTNIMGTDNVLRAADKNGVEKVVVLSTDKAVYPINAMGMSKALAEKIVVANSRMQSESGAVFCATRYGNVMASRGSVIPLFVEQIKRGGPITVTDSNMTRFLMSLEDSVDLVLYAYENANPGDIFVQKAPAATIGILARALNEIFDGRAEVTSIGTRHGEKLYETLVSREELARSEDLDRYFRIPADNRDLNYSRYVSEGENSIAEEDDYTSHNTERLSLEQVKKKLLDLPYIQEQLSA